jgi:hypothetical protein
MNDENSQIGIWHVRVCVKLYIQSYSSYIMGVMSVLEEPEEQKKTRNLINVIIYSCIEYTNGNRNHKH